MESVVLSLAPSILQPPLSCYMWLKAVQCQPVWSLHQILPLYPRPFPVTGKQSTCMLICDGNLFGWFGQSLSTATPWWQACAQYVGCDLSNCMHLQFSWKCRKLQHLRKADLSNKYCEARARQFSQIKKILNRLVSVLNIINPSKSTADKSWCLKSTPLCAICSQISITLK